MKRKSTLLLLYCIKYYDAAIADAILMYGFHQMNGLHNILDRVQKPLVKLEKVENIQIVASSLVSR